MAKIQLLTIRVKMKTLAEALHNMKRELAAQTFFGSRLSFHRELSPITAILNHIAIASKRWVV